jgi:hypothetical protein
VHVALGGVAVGMYAATAFYAIRAPEVSNEPARGGIKLHKYLIYIHAPGMILTPILGAIAFNQANSGEKIHGIASAHSAVAWPRQAEPYKTPSKAPLPDRRGNDADKAAVQWILQDERAADAGRVLDRTNVSRRPQVQK